MSTHPNVILQCNLTPNGLTRQTFRELIAAVGVEYPDDLFKIGTTNFHAKVMGDDYDSSSQISAKEGDIVVYAFATYGYRETVEWDELDKKNRELEAWATEICTKLNCSFKIVVGANYW